MTTKGKLYIWTQIQSGDKTAFDQLYHMHIDSLYNYGHSLTTDTQLIEDSIQEVFINIWTKRSSISITSNVRGYLLTAIRRQILSQIVNQRKTTLKEEFTDQFNFQNTSISSDISISPEDYRLDQVRREIAELSIREREAIVLKYQEGLSYDEISVLMD